MASDKQNDKELERFLSRVDRFETPAHGSTEHAWQRFLLREERGDMPQQAALSPARSRWGLAAFSLLALGMLAAGVYFGYNAFDVAVHVPPGNRQTVELPKGITIQLGAVSSLRYNRIAFYFSPKVYMRGRGVFNVPKKTPFSVETPGGNVTVQGTRFAVVNRYRQFGVACFEGRVTVYTRQNGERLKAGQSVKRIGRRAVKSNAILPELTQWISGSYSFTDAPLHEVIRELETELGLEFIGSIPQRTYTGSFQATHPDTVLQVIFDPLGIEYLRTDTLVVLSDVTLP